jgi:hypothetical protein
MTLVVNESKPGDRDLVIGWLREICSAAQVNAQSGSVNVSGAGPFQPNYTSGCTCLQTIISSGLTVTIQLLDGPGSTIPNTLHTIGSTSGGATTVTNPADAGKEHGIPGVGKGPGADMTVYIDRSNNAQADGRTGYADPADPKTFAPLWLILAHELTTGHAFHGIQGDTSETRNGAEFQAITSENAHRAEHGLTKRTLQPVEMPK